VTRYWEESEAAAIVLARVKAVKMQQFAQVAS
jgi:hypothetical protein